MIDDNSNMCSTVVLAFLLCLCVSAQALAETEIPPRKSGLWLIETSVSDLSEPLKMRQCVDRASDRETQKMSERLGKENCSRNDLRKEGDLYINDTDCEVGGQRMLGHTIISGDFESTYEIETTARFPEAGTESTSTTQARWIGPCEPGHEPGQVIIDE